VAHVLCIPHGCWNLYSNYKIIANVGQASSGLTKPWSKNSYSHGFNSPLSVWTLWCRDNQPCFIVMIIFLADQIFYTSYMHRQHFRLRCRHHYINVRKSHLLQQSYRVRSAPTRSDREIWGRSCNNISKVDDAFLAGCFWGHNADDVLF